MSVFKLIKTCPPLDTNSSYCNLLQCSHFSGTSVIAEQQSKPLGFISGYLIPEHKNVLFVWQVAVSTEARGQGLGKKMLRELLIRTQCNYLYTTITESNEASWRLFLSFAKDFGADTKRSVMFEQHQHFSGQHDTEYLLEIGPFKKINTQEAKK